MNNEEFLKGKEKYKELSHELQIITEKRDSKLLEIETRMKSLEEDEKVKEYITLICEKNKIDNDRLLNPSIGERKARIINEAFDEICKNTQDSNNIYVYMGVYMISGKLIHKFKNLETTKEEHVGLDKYWSFLGNNQIISYPYSDSEVFFKITREKYLRYLSQFSQKTAVNKVLKLGKKSRFGR